MYDLRNIKHIGNCGQKYTDRLIINESYIPFSMLFNLYGRPFDTFISAIQNYKNKKIEALKIEKSTKEWLEQVPYFFERIDTRWLGFTDKISDLYSICKSGLFFRKTHYRSSSTTPYVVGYYSLFKDQFKECYFILVVKKTHIKYVKLCGILGESIMEDCLEFWYDENLINTDIRVKRAFNKLKKDVESFEVPCISKNNILDLLQPKIEFKAPTISAQKKLLEEFSEEFRKEELKELKEQGW